MNINPNLKQLSKTINNHKFTSLEKKRVQHDIKTIIERIQKDEYKKTGFSKNKFNVVDRNKELLIDLLFYKSLAKTWGKLLQTFPLSKKYTIVDLCPGSAPKIEMALYYLQFNGTITAFDISKGSLKDLHDFVSLFAPRYSFSTKKGDIFNINNVIKSQLIVANHILDDLTLYYFAQQQKISLNTLYESEESVKKMWNNILKNGIKNRNQMVTLFSDIFSCIISRDSYICLVQYPSYTEKILDMPRVSQFNTLLFKDVINKMLKNGFKNIPITVHFDSGDHFKKEHCVILQKK